MSDETKNSKCLACGGESKEKFCSMACALMRPDILEADAMAARKKHGGDCVFWKGIP